MRERAAGRLEERMILKEEEQEQGGNESEWRTV